MANISITSTCNRACSYCFAQQSMAQSAGHWMSVEQFEATLDFVERNRGGEVRILGGEPTIHPDFARFVELAVRRKLRVLVFSGGLIPRRSLDSLLQFPSEQVRVLLNVALPSESPQREVDEQRRVMTVLRERVVLGINIHSPAVPLEFLFQLIAELGLAPQVRLGLTHPMLDAENDFLHPRYFDEVGRRVADFAFRARELGIHLEFDCGWVPCMFPEGSLEQLGIGPEQVGLRCNPLLDILPNGEVISCYPLASYHRERLADWEHEFPLMQSFSDRLSPLRPVGIFKRCADCAFRERGDCVGGCISLAQQRLRPSQRTADVVEALPSSPTAVVRPDTLPSASRSTCQDGISVRLVQINPLHRVDECHARHTNAGAIGPAVAKVSPLANAERTIDREKRIWSLPYIDQPLSFWEEVDAELGASIANLYLPLPDSPIGTGRPPQANRHAEAFLRHTAFPKSVLLNVATMAEPVSKVAPAVIDKLRRVHGEFGISQAVVANLELAQRIHEKLPSFSLTASVLMEVVHPYQARLLNEVCSTLVPGSGITRDLAALRAVRSAFQGRIRLLVNEACLPFCPFRAQHFREMAEGVPDPKSLCLELLAEQPWLRLTGSWILPQHLHMFAGIYDELKLAGRVTLQEPERWRRVVHAYVHREKLLPHEIGGGPSSVLEPIDIPDELYRFTLECGRQCHQCTRCPDYYEQAIASVAARHEHYLATPMP